MAKIDRFVAMEKFSKVATTADAAASYVQFDVPYAPVGMIAQVLAPTTGAINVTGLAVTYDAESGKVKVAVTTLVKDSLVSLICF